jgi:hypothetical protein
MSAGVVVVPEGLAAELGLIAAAVPGVLRVQPRPGVAQVARRVLGGLAAATGQGSSATQTADVALVVSPGQTLVELDVVVGAGHSGPLVVRAVAAEILGRLALEVLPPATVDVRIVSVKG